MEQDELLKIVREVGKEVLETTPGLTDRQRELDQAVQAQLSAEGTEDLTVSVRGVKTWLSLVKHFQLARNLGIPEGRDIRYNLGQEEDPTYSADVAREIRDGTINPANALIKSIIQGEIKRARPYAGFFNQKTGKFVPKGIKSDLDRLTASNPKFSKQFAESIERLVVSGQVPKEMSEHADLVAEVTALWFGQEPAREPANIVLSIMSLDIVRQGKLSIGEAIVEHPASTFGYQEAVKGLNADLQGLPRNEVKVKQAKQRIIEKEIATIQRWFEVKLVTGQLKNVSNDRENIKRYILEAVQIFYDI